MIAEGESPQPRGVAFVQSTRDKEFTSLLTLVQRTPVQQEIIPLPASFQTQSTPSANTKGEWGWEEEGIALGVRMAPAIPAAMPPHQDLYRSASTGCARHQ